MSDFQQVSKTNAGNLVNNGEKIYTYAKSSIQEHAYFGSNCWLDEAMKDTSWWKEGTTARKEREGYWEDTSSPDYYSMASSQKETKPWKYYDVLEEATAVRNSDGVMELSDWTETNLLEDEKEMSHWCFWPDVEKAAEEANLVLKKYEDGDDVYYRAEMPE